MRILSEMEVKAVEGGCACIEPPVSPPEPECPPPPVCTPPPVCVSPPVCPQPTKVGVVIKIPIPCVSISLPGLFC